MKMRKTHRNECSRLSGAGIKIPVSRRVSSARWMTFWPPLTASASDKPEGDWTIIKRDDGASQWVYKGKPLYFFKGDKAAGDKSGDGKGDVWHIAKP